ncbi:hypothetical protein Pelo_5046 [Pelomyxa schiedti]|nr:hypothetical protein Pelo_5046 [Pelomyxa schiedti]
MVSWGFLWGVGVVIVPVLGLWAVIARRRRHPDGDATHKFDERDYESYAMLTCQYCNHRMRGVQSLREHLRLCAGLCCPICQERQDSRFFASHVEQCLFACPGCKERVSRGIWTSHYSECPEASIVCTTCYLTYPRRVLEADHSSVCGGVNVTCPDCKQVHRRSHNDLHRAICPMALVLCKNCSQEYPKKDDWAHVLQCGKSEKRKEPYNAHTPERCETSATSAHIAQGPLGIPPNAPGTSFSTTSTTTTPSPLSTSKASTTHFTAASPSGTDTASAAPRVTDELQIVQEPQIMCKNGCGSSLYASEQEIHDLTCTAINKEYEMIECASCRESFPSVSVTKEPPFLCSSCNDIIWVKYTEKTDKVQIVSRKSQLLTAFVKGLRARGARDITYVDGPYPSRN